MSQGFNFFIKNNSPYAMTVTVDLANNNCLDLEFMKPNPFLGACLHINPYSTYPGTIYICRQDGHGCTGCQGQFRMQPCVVKDNRFQCLDWQAFQFDSNGSIATDGTQPSDYGSALSPQSAPGADVTWTITTG